MQFIRLRFGLGGNGCLDGGGTDVNWVLNSLQLKVNSSSALHNLELNELNEFGSNSNVSIIDMTGKIIREEKLGNQKYYNLINQKDIAKGIYLLKINDSNKSKVIKVVKSK